MISIHFRVNFVMGIFLGVLNFKYFGVMPNIPEFWGVNCQEGSRLIFSYIINIFGGMKILWIILGVITKLDCI